MFRLLLLLWTLEAWQMIEMGTKNNLKMKQNLRSNHRSAFLLPSSFMMHLYPLLSVLIINMAIVKIHRFEICTLIFSKLLHNENLNVDISSFKKYNVLLGWVRIGQDFNMWQNGTASFIFCVLGIWGAMLQKVSRTWSFKCLNVCFDELLNLTCRLQRASSPNCLRLCNATLDGKTLFY